MTTELEAAPGAEVRLVWLPMGEVHPAPENDLLYKPISLDDPDIRELAESIRIRGLLQPITVTRDGFIVSGHRRHAACRLLRKTEIACERLDVDRDDPEFEQLLVEYNRQRVKSLDEMLRERVVASNPADAYTALKQHRVTKSRIVGARITLAETKTRKRISRAKLEMLNAVIGVLNEQREYWPLSDRSIHYELLNDPPLRHSGKPESRYRNHPTCYQDLCDLLTRARLVGNIPFGAIEDPTRTSEPWDVHREAGGFLARELDGFLLDYARDLQQSQPNHIEIVGEKNTIEGSIKHVASRYCIPYTVGRGYCSLDPRYKMFQRYKAGGKDKLVILFLSDFDPEGEDIASSFARSMRDDFGVTKIWPRKVCLTYEQVIERDLPKTFDVKKTSSRYKAFARKYGDRAHELEALPSAERSRLLEEAIRSVLDIDAFNAEIEREEADAGRLASLRESMKPALLEALNRQKSD